MRSDGLFLIVASLLAVGGCGTTAGEFKQLCSRSAKLDIVNPSIWKQYVRAAQAYYARHDLDPRDIKIETIDDFVVGSSLSRSKPGSVPHNTPVKTILRMSRKGSTFAIAQSYYISFSGFSGPSPFECARDFPELYKELTMEAQAL